MPNTRSLHDLIQECLLPALEAAENPEQPWRQSTPRSLLERFDFSLGDGPHYRDNEELRGALIELMGHVVNAGHPLFNKFLYTTPDPVGLLGDFIISAMNANVHTFTAAPVLTLAETETLKALREVIGFGEQADGIFCPGGSYSNMMGMFLAREAVRERHGDDFGGRKLIALTSTESHYSIVKSAKLLSLGEDGVVKVPCDRKGRMDPEALAATLEDLHEAGQLPFFINATGGTTVLGAIDPIPALRELADQWECWLHVDGTWGGALLMSPETRGRLAGIETADSLSWDLHKALRAPILCSAFLCKEGAPFRAAMNTKGAEYLYHGFDEELAYELGNRTFQCGRRGDAFKFWLMWKCYGREEFARRVEANIHQTEVMAGLIAEADDFILFDDQPDHMNLCFWHLPEEMRHAIAIDQLSEEQLQQLGEWNERLYQHLTDTTRVLINYAKTGEQPWFLRIICVHPDFSPQRAEELLGVIRQTATDTILQKG